MSGTVTVTILNVDDYPPGLYARSRVLRQAGFEVLEASTGSDALRLAAAAKPDLVLLDVNLPDLNGFEVCRRIKAHPDTASILVLHLSATSVRDADRIRGLEFGADNYLIEPIEPDELIANVHALLRMRRAEQAARAAAAEADARRREAEVLAELARSINGSLDLDRVLGQVAGAAIALCRSDGAQVALRDPAGGAMVLAYRVGARQGRYQMACTIEPGKGVGGQVLASGRPFRTDDYAGDPRISKDYLALAREEGVVCSLAVPIQVGDEVEGILYVVNRSRRPFTDREESILERLADHAAIAIRNGQLFAREQAARAEAEAANRAKDEFLAALSHELRTPLTAMIGWVRLLRSGRLDEATRARAIDAIDRNAEAQAQLIEDLLDVSRIMTGQLRLERRPVDMAAVVAAAVEAIRPAADTKGVRLLAGPGGREVGLVSGDSSRLEQVVSNLLANAVKFTPDGGRVEVSLETTADEVRVRVADTGEGIDPAFLPHVFDRFRQADSTATRAHGGLGLGLAIVRHLVEQHGGYVEAESEGPGRGAVFTVALPRSASDERPATAPGGPAFGAAESVLLDGIRVLLVEDAADSRDLVTVMLLQLGAHVTAVGSARDALAMLERHRPDVLVSDIAMPDEDGYVLIRRVRELPPQQGGTIPAVALSAYAHPDDAARSVEAGFQAHVRKPVRADELVAVIRQLARAAAAR